MSKQSRPDDDKTGMPDAPNQASMKEPAEGSRENTNVGGGTGPGSNRSAGITNRPLDEERREQDSLPPRGTRKISPSPFLESEED